MLFKGNIIHTRNSSQFDIIDDGFILVKEGKVVQTGQALDKLYPDERIKDYSGHLLIPGFVDLHFHAVQYGNLGIGLDEELLDWLNDYTFKEEMKFKDPAYAETIFKSAISHIIDSGTTRIVFFSSIHEEATRRLMAICEDKGICAFVGKVNMNRHAPNGLTEDTDQSLHITKTLLEESRGCIQSIITPRFVPSCTEDLMHGLGRLAQEGYPVQTHISENEHEIEWVKSLHPDAKNYLDVYDKCGLITDKTILAHCVYCTEDEKRVIKERGSFVAHCPVANFNLTSGIMDVKSYLNMGIPVGLGTDVGAGHKTAIKDVMVSAIQMSKVNHMFDRKKEVLTFSEAFYMATKGGGQYFGLVGAFEEGYDFDMLVIKPDDLAVSRGINSLEQLQRFVYSGDDRMIVGVYCKGTKIKQL